MIGVGTFMFPTPVGFGSLAATEEINDETLVQFINIDTAATYTLPAPVIGDSFKMNTVSVVRKSRGLEIKTVNLLVGRQRSLFNISWTWTNLCDADLTTMKSLLYDNIGEIYLMTDVNKEVWRVIILTPSNRIVRQASHIYNITIEAQGILL